MSTKYIASNWRLPNQENSSKSDNYGLTFDGSSEFIDLGTGLLGTGVKSVSFWIKRDTSSPSNDGGIFTIVGSGDTSDYISIALWQDVIQSSVSNTSNNKGSTTLAVDTWYHVVVIKDGSPTTTAIYINGVAETLSTGGTWVSTIDTPQAKIGGISYSSTSYNFQGDISELAVFDYSLSESQISTLYGSSSLGSGNPMALPQPVAYYPLGDNSASNPLTQPNEAVEDASVFDFDGSDNDYLNCGNNILQNLSNSGTIDSAITFSMWFKLGSSTTSRGMLSIGTFTNSYGKLDVRHQSSAIQIVLTNPTASVEYTYSFTDTSSWHSLVIVYNPTSASNSLVYIDGVQAGSNITDVVNLAITSQNLYIGAYYGNSDTFTGQISNVAIWNSDQTTEISNIYNSGVPATTYTNTPTAWYKLDQSANWEADSSGDWQIPDAVSAYPQSFSFSQNKIIRTPNNVFDGIVTGSNKIGICTISYWFKNNNTGVLQDYMSLNDDNISPAYFRIDSSNRILYQSKTNYMRYYAPSDIDGWNHYCWVFNSDTSYSSGSAGQINYYDDDLKFYLNGVEQQLSYNNSAAPNNTAWNGFNIAESALLSDSNLNFKMSNLQLFDTNLSASQVLQLYNNGVPLTTAIASDNLKGWWKLNDNEKFDGTNWEVENQAYPANYETALSFDGSSDYIDCGNDSSLSPSNFTLSVWAKSDLSNGSWISKYASENYGFGIYGGSIFLNIKTSAGWGGLSLTASSYLTANNWHHIVGTYDETDLKIYVDGNPAGTLSKAGPITYSSRDTRIGNLEGTSSLDFNGEISNAAIFNTVLDSSAVTALYNNGTPETSISSSPISWWKLDNLTTGIQDSVGSNDGTNSGATKVNTFVSTEAAISSGMTEQNLVNNNVSVLNGESSGMTSANLVLSDLTRAVPYDSYSFNFDSASGDRFHLSSSVDLGINSTISLWVKFDVLGVVVLGENSYTSDYLMYVDGTNIYIRIDGVVKSFAHSIVISEWYNIVIVREGDSIEVFRNTTSLGTQTGYGTSVNTKFDAIGAKQNGQYPTDGRISNISAFNEAFTSTEVLKLYSNGVPQDITNFTPAPVAWYPLGSNSFWNGSAWTVRDMIGSNDGTGQNIGIDGLVGDSPRSSAGGTGTNMDVPSNLEGSTKWSDNNSWSINMSETARVEDTP